MKKFFLLLSLIGLITYSASSQELAFHGWVTPLKYSTNDTSSTVYVITYLADINHYGFDINISGGVTCKAYATFDESLSETSTTGWADYNTDLFGADSISDVHVIRYQPEVFNPVKVMFKLTYSDDSNSTKIIEKKSL
jgi:hypothetical protein